MLIDHRVHREQARHQLLLAHLQAEDRDTVAEAQRRVVSQRQRHGRIVNEDILRHEIFAIGDRQIVHLLLP